MLPNVRKNSFFPSLMDDFFGKDFYPVLFEKDTKISKPAVNVMEEEKEFNIELAAPGLTRKDFNVDLDHDVLTISSEKEEKTEDKKENFTRREFSYSGFSRSFSLPDTVDAEKIKASYQEGILRVSIPKKEQHIEKTLRKIEIE